MKLPYLYEPLMLQWMIDSQQNCFSRYWEIKNFTEKEDRQADSADCLIIISRCLETFTQTLSLVKVKILKKM